MRAKVADWAERLARALPGSVLALVLGVGALWGLGMQDAPRLNVDPDLFGRKLTAVGMVTDGLGLMRTSFRANVSTERVGDYWLVTEEVFLPDGRTERREWRVRDLEGGPGDALDVEAGATIDRAHVQGVWTLLASARPDEGAANGGRFAAEAPVFRTPYGDGKIEVVFKTTA